MLALELLTWWYGTGWAELAKRSRDYVVGIYYYFSVALLAKTIFAPWKRIITYGSRSISERLRALADNLISRFVGFGVRLLVLLAAAVFMLVSTLVSLVCLVLWPLLPLAVPALLIKMVLPL